MCYFEDYRYSEDLDFTLIDEKLSHDELKKLLNEVFDWVKEETNITIQHKADDTHVASGSSLFCVDFIGPLGGNIGSRDIKIDITRGEKMQFEPVVKEILSNYSDAPESPFKLQCYPLGEVLIEKMAALMGRTESRDLYDFWYLMEVEQLVFDEHVIEYIEKAKYKGHSPENFSTIVLKKEVIFKRDWETKLRHQINDLPKFEDVIREVKRQLNIVDKVLHSSR